MEKQESTISNRPLIANFSDPVDFIQAMIGFQKQNDRQFSILKGCKQLRKVSPTLVTLILKRKRQLTFERVDEFAKLLKLNTQERIYLKGWIEQRTSKNTDAFAPAPEKARKEVSPHILSDWINVYVKDCFEIPSVQADPQLVFRLLAHLANPKRIEKSIQFLMREGHLRKTLQGHIVTEVPLTVMDPQIPSQKIRNFHKGALQIAKLALDSHPAHERYANTLILSMTDEKYQELVQVIQEFAEKLKDFATDSNGPRLYQVLVNLSPTGGKFE